MDELRLSLLILGTCFIVAVLAHGIWKIRKSKSAPQRERIEPRQWDDNDDVSEAEKSPSEDHDADSDGMPNYDDLGLGQVRVVSTPAVESVDKINEPGDAQSAHTDNNGNSEFSSSAAADAEVARTELSAAKPEKLYGAVVSNPKPHLKPAHGSAQSTEIAQDIPAPPEFLIKKERDEAEVQDTESFSLDAPISAQEIPSQTEEGKRAGTKRKSSQRRRQEPKFGDDQMHIDFDTSGGSDGQATTDAQTTTSAGSNESAEQEVLVINVRAADDEPISGAALLPLLLTLGFKFGDQDIFHRHVNANGKGPVLFSLANMFKPGVFDIDNLENFSTQGVSLFMILPIEGDAHQVFNMMHNAARKIADEFGGQILDGRRSVLTKQGLQQYMEKIREFERKRMISRR